jgi:hypothetical protein
MSSCLPICWSSAFRWWLGLSLKCLRSITHTSEASRAFQWQVHIPPRNLRL